MNTSSGGVGASEPIHHETVPEPTMMDVILTADGVQTVVQKVVETVVEVPGCHNCTVLRKELEDCKRDRAFFVDIKRKMILTDTLIQKHQSKCQAFEEQQKSLQNLTTRLAQSKRDCKVLEEQLASTLKDIIPWKKDKERFLQESQGSKTQFEELHNKLSAHESLIRQYESKLEVYDEEKAVLESDIFVLKSKLDSMKQSSRKASTSLEKAKEDNSKLKKEMIQVRKSKASLNMKFERAKTKVKSLCDLLLRHGIKAPRMKGYSSTSDKDEEEEYMEETDSSEPDEGGNSKDTMVTKKMDPRSLAKPVTMPTYHHQTGNQPPPPHSAPPSRRPFPKMDFTSVACLSPLPPSPPDNREERDNSSDGNESDTTLTEAAAKIEAQLSTPVLLRRQKEQSHKEQSRALSARVSPRRKASRRTEARSSGTTDDPESADGAASRRGLRSLKKVPESSVASRTPPTRTSFRASKRLELGNSVEGILEKKRPRGRPRKVKDVSEEKHSSIEKDHREDLSHRLQGRVQTLSSSDDEMEKKDDSGGKRRREQNGVAAIRTRSKTKGHVASGQSVSSPEESKVLPVGRDLALSSDEESKHLLYNPGDSPVSDGSETASVIGRKKKLNLKRQTLRKSSALSDSSESEDDRKQGTHLTRGNNALSTDKRLQSRKPEGVEGKRLLDESIKSNKLASDSETDSIANARRTSRRLAHRQNNIKRQASIEEQTFVRECNKAVEDCSGRDAIKTEDSKNMDKIRSKIATTNRARASDNGEQSLDNSEKVPPGKRVTRQVSRKLLRSLSSPPVTRRSRIGSQDDRSGEDGLSQFQRKPGRGLAKDKNSFSNNSSKEDNGSSKLCPVGGWEDTSSQERTLLRNLSSPARLTRSASRNLDPSESCMPSAEKPCSERKDLSEVRVEHDLTSGEQSSRTKVAESQTRRLSQKRTHSDSQSSEEEKAVKSLKSTNTGAAESRIEDTEQSLKVEDDNEDQSVRNDGKVLMRSETEEFVACMDDMPCMDGGETIESTKQTSASLTAEKGMTIPVAVKDTKKRKFSTKNSKRIKLSAVDTIEEKGESSSCLEGVFAEAGDEPSAVAASRESRNNIPLDRPSTSRGLESSGQAANEEAVRLQPPILFPQQRERHTSSASLPSSERNSPLSPIQEPFQGFAYTRPISPMSPERPVERMSPILPAFFFDLPNIPRMLSPLPPSPPRLLPDEEEAIDVREEDMQEMMSEEIPEAQAQPRMISPLFPTPVPFAVSPIPEMSVPPAISPIADVQHPPKISPIADVQPPVLGVQMVQTVSPGKSPQLPSPRIFHSVAPSDAITVRPQHSSPSYNQDKTTAIRSLNAVLDRDDNTGDHRSSFSKKLIARRSSAEEPGRKPGDMSQNNPSSHSERTGARAISSVNLVPNPAQRTSLDRESTKQSHISTQEQKVNQHLIKGSEDTDLRQSNMNSAGELQGKKDVVQPPLLQTKMQSDFNEYLRRADGHEEATAFSRVIPHRDENRIVASSMQPTKTEVTGSTTEAPSGEKADIMPNSEVKKREELTKGRKVSEAREAVVPDKPKLPSKNTVGNIWGQIAFQHRAERIKHIGKKKHTKKPLVNSQESDSSANPQFKVPCEPPIPATHILAQHSVQQSVQTPGKDQVPRTRGQVFPGFVPASRSKAPMSPQPLDAHHGPALNASQIGPGPDHKVQDLEKTAQCVDQVETSNSSAIQDQAQIGAQDGDPSKTQTKTVFIRPNKTKRLSGPITVDQIKAMKKLHLHDVLRLIRDHSPKESIFPIGKCVIEFLEQNSVNLFPAIYAKCIVGNTSTQPVISPHEEQISKIIIAWTNERKRKNVMHFLLTELSQRLAGQEGTDLNLTVTFSRLFAAICRETDWVVRARLLCYDIIREGLPDGYHLLLAMAAVWPSILRKKDGGVQPMMSTIEMVVMHQLQTDMKSTNAFKRETAEKITKCLAHLCNWQPIASESKGDSHAHWLIGLLKDPSIATFEGDKRQLILGNKCFETIKAVELLASSQGWEWTNNKLIIEQLWPVLKDWSKSLTKSTAEKRKDGTPGDGSLAGGSSTSLGTACAVMKVIGNVGQIGLVMNVQSVEQLMKMLIAVLQQPSQSIPWPMQLYTAQSIYDLSPSNQGVASPVLRQWVSKAANAVPEKLAEQINNLGRKLQSPEKPSQWDVVEHEACEETK